MKRRLFLGSASAVGILIPSTAAAAPPPARPVPAGSSLASEHFQLEFDPGNGSMVALRRPGDKGGMSWISGPTDTPWQQRSLQWGLGYADLGKDVLHRGRWEVPTQFAIDPGKRQARSSYRVGSLEVTVTRVLQGDTVRERYEFTNLGQKTLPMAAGKSPLTIAAPFNDHYTSSGDVMEGRCHAHLWMGGTSAWLATLRMGGRGPHLGLVLNEGALTGYSIAGRDDVTGSNTRGTFLLHTDIANLAPGERRAVAWTMFWHTGWEDFFAQCARRSPAFVMVEAPRHTAYMGEPMTLTLRLAAPDGVRATCNGAPLALARRGTLFDASLPTDSIGERKVELTAPSGMKTGAVFNVVPPLELLMANRVRFIVERQQVGTPGDPAEGAFVVYDNETDAQVRRDKVAARDRNEGRERLGMGVLLARWLRVQPKRDPALMASLERYMAFVSARLQRPDGFVLDGLGRPNKRLYNWPWAAQLHLAYARLTGRESAWLAFMATIESYYANGGERFYGIGLPVFDGLVALKKQGRTADHARLLDLFERHGRILARTGAAYPSSEVNYEQSIVAPAAVFLLELHRATGAAEWLQGARLHLALLELFNGRQPDHHLHDVAIRHWDGYWFGKYQLWGDTFPHYWSTLTAVAFHHYAKATGEAAYSERAEQIIRNNLSLFTADGRGSAAFVYPVSVNGRKAHVADPYANDQDWALVHALQMRED